MTRALHFVALLFQGAILLALGESVRRRNVAAAVNAVVVFLVALLPGLATIAWHESVVPELPLWLAIAGFLHVLGMLGLYESVWWWDHLTHVVSAALLAALVYAAAVVTGETAGFGLPPWGVTLGFALVAGVCWELLELVAREVGERLGVDPVLVYYGRLDTAYDLVFDLVGTLLVVALDVRAFVPLAGQAPEAAEVALLWGGGLLLVVSVGMALALWRVHGRIPI